jgi:Fe-S-cluster-containing dehydrogenase component/formylmethanofuran dehydrogenase subunit D
MISNATNAMSTDVPGNPLISQNRTLIDDLLGEQQLLTPVVTFSQKHERHAVAAQEKYYSDLIPLSSPAPGEQYAFAVDLDACTGCQACVTACHNMNGLDDNETWRDVGVLFGGTVLEPLQQTITTACHHCVDPGCVNGCPVNAYDKDPVTGIVRHLDDQCIGCQYCIWKCPYDVPKYSKKRGIVRKCDMCSSRLAVGEAPACVQACPNEAISITLVNKQQIAHRWKKKDCFLPGSPDPDYTLPTTQYRSNKTLPPNMSPGDLYVVKPEHAHLPLVVMLVLTQLSVGAFCTATILRLFFPSGLLRELAPFHSLVVLLLGFLALGASTMHLGRPLEAWRSFVGLKTSWLSREIIVFGLFQKWSSPESVFQILKELSRGQPCEITGIRDYQMIDEAGGIQWPLPDPSHHASGRKDDAAQVLTISVEPERRLFEDGLFYHSDKRARFLFENPRDVPEPTDKEYPFMLLTGRGTSSQWHTQTRTGKSAVLKKLYPDHIYLEMNPLDAEHLGIAANQKVIIASRRGEVTATAFITNTVQAGQLFIPIHYSVANELTFPAFDPYSRQPAYKACAVSVTPL